MKKRMVWEHYDDLWRVAYMGLVRVVMLLGVNFALLGVIAVLGTSPPYRLNAIEGALVWGAGDAARKSVDLRVTYFQIVTESLGRRVPGQSGAQQVSALVLPQVMDAFVTDLRAGSVEQDVNRDQIYYFRGVRALPTDPRFPEHQVFILRGTRVVYEFNAAAANPMTRKVEDVFHRVYTRDVPPTADNPFGMRLDAVQRFATTEAGRTAWDGGRELTVRERPVEEAPKKPASVMDILRKGGVSNSTP
jgi:hypothetical protein